MSQVLATRVLFDLKKKNEVWKEKDMHGQISGEMGVIILHWVMLIYIYIYQSVRNATSCTATLAGSCA